jgi:hypothetical protein
MAVSNPKPTWPAKSASTTTKFRYSSKPGHPSGDPFHRFYERKGQAVFQPPEATRHPPPARRAPEQPLQGAGFAKREDLNIS